MTMEYFTQLENITYDVNDSATDLDARLDEDTDEGPGVFGKVIISIIGLALIITILGGNGLVLTLLIRFRHLRTTTNYFISGMAIADFITGIMLIVSVIIRQNPQLTITPFGCLLFWCSAIFPGCASCLTLLSVSCDRYFKVLMPYKYQAFMSTRKAVSIVAAIYIYTLLVSYCLPLAGMNQTDKEFDDPCFLLASRIYPPTYFQFLGYVNILLPLLLIVLMYSHLFRVVVIKIRGEKAKGNLASAGMKVPRLWLLKREFKTVKTLIMLLGLCICGWVPLSCILLIELYNPDYRAGLGVRTIVEYMLFLNSAFNPILYSLRSEHFRELARRLICGNAYLRVRERKRRIVATVYPMNAYSMEPSTARINYTI